MIKWRVEHAEALDLIAYGLAKFAGSKGKNEIATYISGSRSAFFRRLVEVGIAKSTNAVSNRQDHYDPFFGIKKGYHQKSKEYAPRKERLDSIVGNLSLEEYAAFIEVIIDNETGKPVSSDMLQLIERAKLALSEENDEQAIPPEKLDKTEPPEEHIQEPVEDSLESTRLHTEVQWVLKQLGIIAGCQVFIAQNDRSTLYNGEPLSKGCVEALPHKGIFTKSLYNRLSRIDVVWIKKNKIICAFEVECSTSIYSGILRMSDLAYSMPYDSIKGYIVAPESRKKEVIKELKRPTFSNEHIQGFIRYITVEELTELYDRFADLKPGAITSDVLEQKAHIVECEGDE